MVKLMSYGKNVQSLNDENYYLCDYCNVSELYYEAMFVYT